MTKRKKKKEEEEGNEEEDKGGAEEQAGDDDDKATADGKQFQKKQSAVEKAKENAAKLKLIYAQFIAEKVKILTTSMQMLSLFANADSYPTDTPPAYVDFINALTMWANVDFYSFFNIGCLQSSSYLDATMIRISVPTVPIVLAMVGAFVFHKKGDAKKESLCMQFVVVFTFLIFVSTTNVRGLPRCTLPLTCVLASVVAVGSHPAERSTLTLPCVRALGLWSLSRPSSRC